AQALQRRLTFPHGAAEARETSDWLRKGAPLGRQMHRNTRETLRAYHKLGMLEAPPPTRQVADVVFDYQDERERDVYKAIKTYIDRRFEQLEGEKAGKGFVMTVYRRRLASSPYALKASLRRRLHKLEQVIKALTPAALVWTDEDETIADRLELEPDLDVLLDEALPKSAEVAHAEAADIRHLLGRLDGLDQTDSKRDRFFGVLERALADSRRVLVFTEYADTMRYLRDWLRPVYKERIGCYSGEGGRVIEDGEWKAVTKAEITRRLFAGQLDVLICTDAASEGLNLQEASVVINYDLPWNPSRVEQRIGRVDRIGQARAQVWVRNLFLADSVDMRVYELLRQRCGLFTHFVGHMQPVLDQARRALADPRSGARLEAVLSELEGTAQELEGDEVVRQAFVEAEARTMAKPQPALDRVGLRNAMVALTALQGKVRAKRDQRRDGWWVYGLGRARRLVVLRGDALEASPDAEPLTATSSVVGELAEALPGPAISPLVVASQEQGAFRCCEARWVSESGIERVASVERLGALIEAWSGQTPPLDLMLAAQKEADHAAADRLEKAVERASQEERMALQQQLAAARLRLLRELGRTLACAGDDLDRVLRGQVSREGARPGRYRHAVRLLGGYPAWATEETQDAREYAAGLSEGQRSARLAGSELDAALADPRWLAVEGLKGARE
ncbi:MAG: hypothetical protein GX601_09315, partial [Anaerolineales bacterium]|nr:hypothetical protein [Anaerolineales bacterium]